VSAKSASGVNDLDEREQKRAAENGLQVRSVAKVNKG